MTTSSGLLLVDKPRGVTSHDVVARLRLILNEKRVGHAGTLDPMATGLLVLGVGTATRLLRFAQSETKHYRGQVTLGVATDSLDADGQVTERHDVPDVNEVDVARVTASMLGDQQQIPPMVSALRVGGRRLHALAREGIDVVREPRDITVSSFSLVPSDEKNVWNFEVTCSVGTYVRVLLSDVAKGLGTVGHLSALRRVSSGSHHVDDALTLDDLARCVESGAQVVKSPSLFVTGLESVTLTSDQERRMRMGQKFELDGEFKDDEIAALSEDGLLIGVLRRRPQNWKPEIVLVHDDVAPEH
jgi:tRNA pseudouridine55 synthase